MRIIVLIKPGVELDESDACAVEQALRIARRRIDIQVSVLTAGPSACARALRAALALGADDAVHVADPRIPVHDALVISRVLAATIREIGYDLILCGAASEVPNLTALPAMVAARLGVPALLHVTRVDLALELPALISVTESSAPPRYPPFPAIAEARHKLLRTRMLKADSLISSAIKITDSTPHPRSTTMIKAGNDPHAAAVQLVDFLAEHRFI
jgi:electron transfer flavoprotein beta subunit